MVSDANSFFEHDLWLRAPGKLGRGGEICDRDGANAATKNNLLQNWRREIGQSQHATDEPVGDFLPGGNVMDRRHLATFELAQLR